MVPRVSPQMEATWWLLSPQSLAVGATHSCQQLPLPSSCVLACSCEAITWGSPPSSDIPLFCCLSGKPVERPRSAVKCMASSTGTSGAQPAGGRRPASASWTEPASASPAPHPAAAVGRTQGDDAAWMWAAGAPLAKIEHLKTLFPPCWECFIF